MSDDDLGYSAEDAQIFWQDVLDSLMSGRTSNLICPICKKGAITVTERNRVTVLQCQNSGCRQFIEVGFSNNDMA